MNENSDGQYLHIITHLYLVLLVIGTTKTTCVYGVGNLVQGWRHIVKFALDANKSFTPYLKDIDLQEFLLIITVEYTILGNIFKVLFCYRKSTFFRYSVSIQQIFTVKTRPYICANINVGISAPATFYFISSSSFLRALQFVRNMIFGFKYFADEEFIDLLLQCSTMRILVKMTPILSCGKYFFSNIESIFGHYVGLSCILYKISTLRILFVYKRIAAMSS